jgi:hypothetical protein
MRKIQIVGSDTRMAAVFMVGSMAVGMIFCAHFFDGQAFQRATEILLLLITIIGSVYIVTLFLNWPSDCGRQNEEGRTEMLYQRSLQPDIPFSAFDTITEPGRGGLTIGKIREGKNFLLGQIGKTWRSLGQDTKPVSVSQRQGGNDLCNPCKRIPAMDDSEQGENMRGYDIEEVINSLNIKTYKGGTMETSFMASPADYDFNSNMIRCGRYMVYDQDANIGNFVPLAQISQVTDRNRSSRKADYDSKQDKKIVEMYRDGANVSKIAKTVFKNTNGWNTKKVRTVLDRYGVV